MKKILNVLILCTLAITPVAVWAADAPPAPPAPVAPQAQQAVMPVSIPPPTAMPRPCVLMALRILQPRMTAMLQTELGLSEDQKAKVVDLISKADEAEKPLVEAQRKASEAFVAALVNPASDTAVLAATGDAAMKAEAAILSHRVKTYVALRALLTPDQDKQFLEMVDKSTMAWKAIKIPRPILEQK